MQAVPFSKIHFEGLTFTFTIAWPQFVGGHKYKAVTIRGYPKRFTNAKTKIVHRTRNQKGSFCLVGIPT